MTYCFAAEKVKGSWVFLINELYNCLLNNLIKFYNKYMHCGWIVSNCFSLIWAWQKKHTTVSRMRTSSNILLRQKISPRHTAMSSGKISSSAADLHMKQCTVILRRTKNAPYVERVGGVTGLSCFSSCCWDNMRAPSSVDQKEREVSISTIL